MKRLPWQYFNGCFIPLGFLINFSLLKIQPRENDSAGFTIPPKISLILFCWFWHCYCAWRAFLRWMIKEQRKSAPDDCPWKICTAPEGRWNNFFFYIIFCLCRTSYSLGWRWFQLILGAVAAELARSLNEREGCKIFPSSLSFSSDWATGAKGKGNCFGSTSFYLWLTTPARSFARFIALCSYSVINQTGRVAN